MTSFAEHTVFGFGSSASSIAPKDLPFALMYSMAVITVCLVPAPLVSLLALGSQKEPTTIGDSRGWIREYCRKKNIAEDKAKDGGRSSEVLATQARKKGRPQKSLDPPFPSPLLSPFGVKTDIEGRYDFVDPEPAQNLPWRQNKYGRESPAQGTLELPQQCRCKHGEWVGL
ncbi:hypothetical protein OCU04_009806 [Sclerotinia nivalis]|uniref:Uncharacterized protein n=1 Tax=Sclerotinia nivalis TaxID=352851 RepID=A0A9X0DGW2_9HELO|nr:hypothetical protein OCU04_009806 [Sclerotinia nivalis]